jgi:hypothetical protein
MLPTLAIGFHDMWCAFAPEVPLFREPQPIDIELERAVDVGNEQGGSRMPVFAQDAVPSVTFPQDAMPGARNPVRMMR